EYRLPEVRLQRVEIADMAQLRALPVQLLGLRLDRRAENTHQAGDFLLGTSPVLGRERPKGEVADAELRRARQHAADVLGPGLMAFETGETTLPGPSPIAIHDDGDVSRNAIFRDIGRGNVRMVLGLRVIVHPRPRAPRAPLPCQWCPSRR